MSDRPARWVAWGIDGAIKMAERYIEDGVRFGAEELASIKQSTATLVRLLDRLHGLAAEHSAKASDIPGTSLD
jgi:hypothetical protein